MLIPKAVEPSDNVALGGADGRILHWTRHQQTWRWIFKVQRLADFPDPTDMEFFLGGMIFWLLIHQPLLRQRLWRALSALSNISSASFSLLWLWLWLWLWIHGEASALLTLSHLAFPHLLFLSHITTSHSQHPGLMRFLVSRLVQIANSPVLASFLCCLAHLSFATSSGRSNL